MRTVYLGTSDFAAGILRDLAAAGRAPALVLTRPDRPRGRGRHLGSPPVAQAARELGLEIEQPATVNGDEALATIAAHEPRLLIVCAFGALIKEPLLSAYEILNVHPSLLPRWRGAAPIERAIMAGDTATGVSIMRLTAGLDSGPVCLAGSEPIQETDTYGTLAAHLRPLAAALLLRALELAGGDPPGLLFSEQDDSQATYAEKITAADRLLDPARPARELARVVRALQPHIGARLTMADARLLGVVDARAVDEGPPPGQLAADEGRLLWGTAAGALELLRVQPPGGRAMDAAAYLRGHAL